MATLGSKLINLRKEHKLSQAELAEKLNISQNAYNKCEADKCKPNADNLQKISIFYNIDIAELLDENGKMVVSGNSFKNGNNIIAQTIPTVNINNSQELIDQVLKNQQQIIQLMENQQRLFEKILKN